VDPALGREHVGDPPELGVVGDLHGLAFHDEVERVRSHRDDAAVIVREIPRLARAGTGVEVESAVHAIGGAS